MQIKKWQLVLVLGVGALVGYLASSIEVEQDASAKPIARNSAHRQPAVSRAPAAPGKQQVVRPTADKSTFPTSTALARTMR